MKRVLLLNALAFGLFVLDPLVPLALALVLSDLPILRGLMAPVNELLEHHVIAPELSVPALLGSTVCPIGALVFGAIASLRYCSRTGAFVTGMAVMLIVIRMSFYWLA